jgi:thiol-disulfide isomerase/thioredoxin
VRRSPCAAYRKRYTIKKRILMEKNLKLFVLLINFFVLIQCGNDNQFDKQEYQFQQYVNDKNWPALEKLISNYMNSEEFIAHTAGFGILPEIIKYPELLDLSERLVQKCIQENSIDNLNRLGSENANEQKQNIDFVYYYSQYAWILWKKEKYSEARVTINKAIEYQVRTGLEITPQELLRLGIIEYYNDNKEGWQKIQKALIAGTDIEKQDEDYPEALEKIITIELGHDIKLEKYIETFRKENKQAVPELTLISFDNIEIDLNKQHGRILFINFFSPNCGSCRYELPKIKEIYDQYSNRQDVMFLFILDKPNMRNEGIELLKKIGYKNVSIFTVKSGSAWDYIKGEPTTWIINRDGKFAYRHLGYKSGIEEIYRQELNKLL